MTNFAFASAGGSGVTDFISERRPIHYVIRFEHVKTWRRVCTPLQPAEQKLTTSCGSGTAFLQLILGTFDFYDI